jgi:hypothetical protein
MLARTAEIGQKRTLNGFQNSDMNNILNKLTVVAVDPPDEESATVTLRSEHSELVAFCWPCDLKVGDTVENRLSVLDADVLATYLSDWSKSQKEELSQEWIERTGHYTYRGRGASSIKLKVWSKFKDSLLRCRCCPMSTLISKSPAST